MRVERAAREQHNRPKETCQSAPRLSGILPRCRANFGAKLAQARPHVELRSKVCPKFGKSWVRFHCPRVQHARTSQVAIMFEQTVRDICTSRPATCATGCNLTSALRAIVLAARSPLETRALGDVVVRRLDSSVMSTTIAPLSKSVRSLRRHATAPSTREGLTIARPRIVALRLVGRGRNDSVHQAIAQRGEHQLGQPPRRIAPPEFQRIGHGRSQPTPGSSRLAKTVGPENEAVAPHPQLDNSPTITVRRPNHTAALLEPHGKPAPPNGRARPLPERRGPGTGAFPAAKESARGHTARTATQPGCYAPPGAGRHARVCFHRSENVVHYSERRQLGRRARSAASTRRPNACSLANFI